MNLIRPLLLQGYHLFVDNFYTSVALVRDLFNQGVMVTGTMIENRRGFPQCLKNEKEWAKRVARGGMRWFRVPPVLALQWNDNKVVSMLTTSGSANAHHQVSRSKTNNVYREVNVPQPDVINEYNRYMNAVDRSDQILFAHNCLRKCVRWWKTLFYHLIDIAVVNAYILFRRHHAANPDNEALRRKSTYSLLDFREELLDSCVVSHIMLLLLQVPGRSLQNLVDNSTQSTCPGSQMFEDIARSATGKVGVSSRNGTLQVIPITCHQCWLAFIVYC